jgi:hypothetical protein
MNGKTDKINQEQALDEYYAKEERLYQRGKIMCIIISAVLILNAVFSGVFTLNLLTIPLMIVLVICFYKGFSGVRYFFAVTTFIDAFLLVNHIIHIRGSASGLTAVSEYEIVDGVLRHVGSYVRVGTANSIPPAVLIVLFAILAFRIWASIVLFVSKSISTFLYEQRNG